MIIIGKPYLESKSNTTRCICNIDFENDVKTIWFEVEKKYEKYLCDDRCDAYLVGILNYAMRKHEDIKCEAPITENLLYNINIMLKPILAKYSQNLKDINIYCETIEPVKSGEFIGTGCSGGIDSFDAIYSHINTKYKNMDITHLCINNVGAFNDCYKDYGIDKIKNERYSAAEKIAKKLNLELIETNSNFQEIEQDHLLTATYSSCFAIYMLQKMWKIYYYASSGIDYSKFNLYKNDLESCAHYDLLALQAFSIPNLRIYSEGGEKTRFQKTKDISDIAVVQEELHVCTERSENCGHCPKCRRTLLTLEALGKLNEFSKVFNVEDYYKNRDKNYMWLIKEHIKKSDMTEPIYKEIKKQNKLNFSLYIRTIFYYAYKKILKKRD